ncbi:hypothetical protein [Cellulomonas marina]|uniref:Uncharacterized protein n=1 Tax=Cellulomonas marina TaxID=988821 RepID=A0A1I1ACE7_9CELL|nr:hypothetical protein [Cellulomonas marina]GIG29742.1 hypothetical protein Cma02nite_23420 [Cellulomonas marina]SFB35654.1 hypothetical protein SAMN05421867_11712 [Cellulomonas marina]
MTIPPSRPRPARIGETPIYDQVVAERGDPAQWGAATRTTGAGAAASR